MPEILMAKHRIGGIPIIDEHGTLQGIVTNRDLRFESDMNKKLGNIMTKQPITAKEGTNLVQAEAILQSHKVEKLPIVDSKGILVGLITKTLKMNFPNACGGKMN